MSDETKPEIPQDLSAYLPTTKTPNQDVIIALWAYVLGQTEKAQSISAEARERVTNQSELAGLNRKAFNTVMSAIRKGKKHQFEAIEDLKHTMLLCMWGIEEIQKQGHTGDIAEMAAKSAEQPKGSKPAEPKPEEPKQDASNIVQLEQMKTPKEAKAAKAAKAPKASKAEKKGTAGESLKETVAAGDEHIKKVAAGETPEAPTPPRTMPDIPADLDRRGKPERERTEDPENRAHGKYRLLS
jgi:hypothetical protein